MSLALHPYFFRFEVANYLTNLNLKVLVDDLNSDRGNVHDYEYCDDDGEYSVAFLDLGKLQYIHLRKDHS